MASIKWSEKSLVDLDHIDFQVSKRIVLKVSWLANHFDNIILEPLHNNLLTAKFCFGVLARNRTSIDSLGVSRSIH